MTPEEQDEFLRHRDDPKVREAERIVWRGLVRATRAVYEGLSEEDRRLIDEEAQRAEARRGEHG